ncbi:acyl-CoA dehydrogenase family protein [Kineococcus glutinatus]|uniref:Acyl-CoA dehydrogenase family protein n=1 Tax=Kineococcus glutinatus TaxID=1070872 RepID=A0ABP8VD17_9ACTN
MSTSTAPATGPTTATGPSFGLTAAQQEWRARAREFAQQRVAPVAADLYRRGEYPVELVRAMGAEGFFGLGVPEADGGSGGGLLELCLVVEEIGRVDQSLGITLESAAGLGAAPLHRAGTAEQKQRWLGPLLRGEKVAGFGLTEPGGGSDNLGLRTRARLDGGEWVIDGRKAFIGNAGSAITSHVTVTAVTGTRPDGRPEVSTVIVPAGTPGFEPQPRNDLVGWRTIDNRDLVFRGCRVPVANTLGARGAGLRTFLGALDAGRVAIAALAVGMLQGCLDACTARARERQAFGRPIGANQGVAFPIADMAVAAQLARDATWRAAWLADTGRPYGREACTAKLYATEAAARTARAAVQVFGGEGFTNDSLVGRFYRDAKVLEIGEGTSEVQRVLIARHLGLPGPA